MDRITLNHISVAFKQGKKELDAVKNISFSVAAGEIFGLVGLSGAGKSTLIRTINLLQPPTAGEVLLDGENIIHFKGQKLKDTRKKIGMIFQHFNLIQNRTVGENILFALKAGGYPKDKVKDRIHDLLQLVDLIDKIDVYPARLSGGQKQRIGIARALANNPEILLCDEATSALDVETTEEILQLLENINRKLNLTILFITHELEVAKRLFDRIAVMEQGEIVELDSTYEIFANPKAEITKKLVGRYFNLTIPNELKATLNAGDLVKLHYQGTYALAPLISKISKEFPVELSIIHGKIEYICNQPVGLLIIYITGKEEVRAQVLSKIRENVSYMEILSLGKGENTNE